LYGIYKNNEFAKIVSKKNDEIFITVGDGERQIPHILNLASTAGIPIMSVSLHKPTLDDVFIRYTGHAIRDKDVSETEHARHKIHSRRK
jgi:ABC-2 type transport system ATP-binding protein